MSIRERFFQDPEWGLVIDEIAKYIDPMRDLLTIDVSKDAEDVKAQVIARQIAFSNLDKFLQDSKVTYKPLSENKPNKFR